jgi:uncharacterized protein
VKYLILIGVVFAVIWWIKLSRPSSRAQRESSDDSPQTMVACAQCGVHLPEQDAVHAGSARYCSQAHRALKEGSA